MHSMTEEREMADDGSQPRIKQRVAAVHRMRGVSGRCLCYWAGLKRCFVLSTLYLLSTQP